MTDWQKQIAPFVRAVEKRYDALKYRLYYGLGGPGPIKIESYRGYGTPEKLYLMGRVLEKRGITVPSDTDSWWDNLVNMFKRLQSYEIPHARLLARFQEIEQEIVADEEGMFEVEIEPLAGLADDQRWQSIGLELLEPQSARQKGPVRATGEVLIPPLDASFGVISDIDDTVIQSNVGSFLQTLSTILFGNARTRLPLPGVAAFYRALHDGSTGKGKRPMFYVSNGLWNLYDLLQDFFELNGIPGGAVLLLRNWGIYRDELLPTRQQAHKMRHIRPILDLYADLPFILIGDSGEADPEIYYELVHEYGERILAVYIRNVGRDLDRPAAIRALAREVLDAGSELILADDSLSMARHAAEKGWIAQEVLAEIAAEQRRDEGGSASLLQDAGDRVRIREEPQEGDIRSSLKEADQEGIPTVVVEPAEKESTVR